MARKEKDAAEQDTTLVVEREEKTEAAGIIAKRERETEYKPPLLEVEEKPPEIIEEEEIKVVRPGKIPIVAGAVRLPLRFEGEFLAVMTGWDGWKYSEEDLADIVQLVQECGLQASPVLQLIAALSGVHAAKLAAFAAWKRKAKKEAVLKA